MTASVLGPLVLGIDVLGAVPGGLPVPQQPRRGVHAGLPVSSSGSRTALGVLAGSPTQLYSLVALVVVACVPVFGGGFVVYVPSAALGALII